MPSVLGRTPEDTFEPLLQRIQRKLAWWCVILLSKARRQVLVDWDLIVMPTYVMSCSLQPIKVLDKIDKMRMNFFMGSRYS